RETPVRRPMVLCEQNAEDHTSQHQRIPRRVMPKYPARRLESSYAKTFAPMRRSMSTPRTSVSNNGTIARTWPSNRSQMLCICSSCIARRLRTNSAQSSGDAGRAHADHLGRSEEHTSELQSRGHLVCRLLLEKKKKE